MKTKLDIAKDWLPRYTGMGAEDYGDYVLLTNFHGYFESFELLAKLFFFNSHSS